MKEFFDLFRWIRPHRRLFWAATVASIVSMGFGLTFPWLAGRMINAAIPPYRGVPSIPWCHTVDQIAGVLMVTLAIQAALTFFSSYSFNRVGESSVVALRKAVYGRLISLPMEYFGKHRVGELTSRMSNDLAQIHEVLTFVYAAAIRQTMMFVGGIVLIAITSWRLTLIMISTFPVLIIVAVLMGRGIRRLSRAAQDQLAESATVVEETFQNIASVKAFTNESYENRRYGATLDRFFNIALPSARYRGGLIAFIIIGIFGSIVLVLWQGARQMKAGLLPHGDLTTFMLYTMLVGGAVGSFAEIVSQIQKALGATERVREILREPTEPLEEIAGMDAVPRLKGNVSFENVHFSYPSRPDLPVLKGFSLEAHAGDKLALVGPSGAGKSTVVSLLLRFYNPASGLIRFDGCPGPEFAHRTVRSNIAVVPQEVLLFGGTIRENIAYGRPNATEEEIRSAAERAHCAEFIARLPEGYETRVGERGVQLSGGQRQRIAIARAFLRDPAILILDEATSALDAESESLIQQALETLLVGRTAIIIAHRLATVRRCDRIYVMDRGGVVECGTHEELVARADGVYRRLAEMQFSS